MNDLFPVAAAPAPRRQLLVGTALACAAGTMLIGGMLAIWVLLRSRAVAVGARFPVDYIVNEVASNVMLMTLVMLCLFAQWAVYSGVRGDRIHTAVALGVVSLFAVAFINGQAFIWHDMAVPIREAAYGSLFWAMTGTMTALVVAGLVFTLVATFRILAGRLPDSEILSAHALYWYFITTAFSAVWFVVYVTK